MDVRQSLQIDSDRAHDAPATSGELQKARARIRELEDALRASEERFRTAFDQMPMALSVTSLEDSKLLDVNDSFLRMSGFSRGEIIGRTPEDVGLWVDPAVRAQRFALLRAGRTPPAIEASFRGKDGQVRSGLIASRLVEFGGRPCVLSCNVDITERQRAEELLRQADRRKDEFLASLAHELRNPLAPLNNGLEVMRLAADPAVLEQVRGMMGRQVAQLVRLVDDLLDVSRISRGRIDLRREPVALASLVDSAVETCREAIRAADLELRVSLPAEPVVLDADRVRLVQVLGNLLSNAVKFTPRGGVIVIEAENHGDEAVIRVRDSGIGIAPDVLDSVFDLFVQADRSLERGQAGLGVGLTIVRRLVELHGGRVAVCSPGADQGSEFTVRLPLPARTLEPGAPAASAAAPAREARRILIVDDNRDAATSLGMALRLMRHEVRIAYDGVEALNVGEFFRPEIALLDIGMPKLNGYGAARAIRARSWGRHATLVALTGFGQSGDLEKSRGAGFDHHLVKPADMGALCRILAATARPRSNNA